MIECWVVNGPPEVDDLEALVDELLRLLRGQVSVDASDGGLVGLIDMGE